MFIDCVDLLPLSCTQEAVQEAAAMHCGHSEELPGLLLEEEVPAPPLGSTHLPETCARPAGPPGLQPAAGGEEEEGGGGALQEDGGVGEVGRSSKFYRHVTHFPVFAVLNTHCLVLELWRTNPLVHRQ